MSSLLIKSFLPNSFLRTWTCLWSVYWSQTGKEIRKITTLSGKHSFTLHPSLSPYGQTELRRNEYTRFAWAGGIYPPFAWAWGTFFPVVLLCQFLVLAGNRFWLYILLCTWSTIQLWCCVSFFGSGGKKFLAGVRLLLRPEKKSSSRLSGGCTIVITTGKKKF
jgi:hypothetical protein